MEDLRQSLAESCDSLKLCKIRAAYYVENGEVQLNADDILKCYDTFEWLVERLFDTMQSVFTVCRRSMMLCGFRFIL